MTCEALSGGTDEHLTTVRRLLEPLAIRLERAERADHMRARLARIAEVAKGDHRLRRHRAAQAHEPVGSREIGERRQGVPDQGLRLAVQDHAHGAVGRVLQDEDHGAAKIVEQRGRGDQELATQALARTAHTVEATRSASATKRPAIPRPSSA